jgi:hypothetical protein
MSETASGYERWHNAGSGRRAQTSALENGDGRFNAYLRLPSARMADRQRIGHAHAG